MIKFLDTPAINHYLNELLKNANSKIILVSPFIKLQGRIKDILKSKKEQGIEIILVCRVKDIQEPIDEYCTRIFDMPTLHAKCYMNESEAILTSLNLHEFSQINNDEMGVYVKNQNDGVAIYKEIVHETERLCKNEIVAEPLTQTKPITLPPDSILEIGKKYTTIELQDWFKFDYPKPAGIKLSSSGDIVLFNNGAGFKDKQVDNIFYFYGQNTGGREQELKYGNKLLYDSFGNSKRKIYLFKNLIFAGKHKVDSKPYKEQGEWVFPLSKI